VTLVASSLLNVIGGETFMKPALQMNAQFRCSWRSPRMAFDLH
jgi:hypothetical protein